MAKSKYDNCRFDKSMNLWFHKCKETYFYRLVKNKKIKLSIHSTLKIFFAFENEDYEGFTMMVKGGIRL